ncbi:ArnT family glycosyltransferase [Halobium palmae]|uniref:ArnT family glycosyltransferase n=1 Tax=Halobium palmae TaxID=1776492 RepID=A0ABD5S150_9EURY
MRPVTGGLLGRARRRLVDDLRRDPYLPYVLLLAAVLAGFWFWHRVPNFATRDERLRIVDPMTAVGIFADDPGVDSLLRAMGDGREFGATFYLYGLALVPVFVAAFVTGQLDAFTALPGLLGVDHWAEWNETPRWIWTWSILLGRLVNVAFAVGCVYVTYRIGTEMRDRATGRLAAVLLSLTWGLLVLAHEVGEDVPALFFFLLVAYLGLRYAQTGEESLFLASCVCGGVAIALKLTTVVCVVLIVVAYLLRVRNAGSEWRDALARPGLFVGGAVLGAVVIVLGFPTVLTHGIDVLGGRILRGATGKGEPHNYIVAPTWWWLLRGYLNGLGLPLFVAAVGAVGASVPLLRERTTEAYGLALSFVGVGTFLLLYARWAYIRTHHLLPTFPLLALVVAVVAMRSLKYNRSLARPFVALLLVTTALYAGVGDLGYATQPRDRATAWLATNAPENATVETYSHDPQEAAVPHGMTVYRPSHQHATEGSELSRHNWTLRIEERCPDYVELNYYYAFYQLAPESHSARAEQLSRHRLDGYYSSLIRGGEYPYDVVAEFGPRPEFVRESNASADRLPELLRVGIDPRSIQYGDPQDFGVDQYTMILERTGRCTVSS